LGGQPPPVEEPDEEPEQQNPMMTQDVGGVTMAINRATGKTDWATTLVGALPKLGETAQKVFGEYQKIVKHQHDSAVSVMRERTNLANAVVAAQQAMQTGAGQAPSQRQALPQPAPTQQTQSASQPVVQSQPAQPAQAQAQAQPVPQSRPVPVPVPAAPVAPPKKPGGVPIPTGPIWG